MDDKQDYLDLRDAIDVPWDELRSERTLKKILEASVPHGDEVEPVEAEEETSRRPWLMVAAAALVLGSAGITAAVLQQGDADETARPAAPQVVAQADEALPPKVAVQPKVVPTTVPEPAPESLLDNPESGSLLAFADGAHARLGTDASVRVLSDSPREIRIGQEKGSVVYKVDPVASKKRDVVVEVAHLYIMVQGSHFSASLTENKVAIEVDEGSVVVVDGEKQLELVEGDSLRLERQGRLDEAEINSKPGRKAKAVHASGKKADASALTVDDLMKRADKARQAGDLATSAAALEQLVRGEAEGKAPPVTWMTLGRVERRRGNHQAAAQAFESYWKRYSGRPLAEDALHEAFVSWRAAGRSGEARRVAQEYLEAFPGGLHADQMATYLP
mgnify:CR=1 FL=1